MKYVIALLTCAVLATALPDIDMEVIEKTFREAHKTCDLTESTRVDVDEDALKNGEPPSEKFAAHIFCVSKILGWQDKDGYVNKDSLRSQFVTWFGSNPLLDPLLEMCGHPQGTPEATALNIFKCYMLTRAT